MRKKHRLTPQIRPDNTLPLSPIVLPVRTPHGFSTTYPSYTGRARSDDDSSSPGKPGDRTLTLTFELVPAQVEHGELLQPA